jgi:hypothetical protein
MYGPRGDVRTASCTRRDRTMLENITLASLTAEAVEASYWTKMLCGPTARQDIDKVLKLNRQRESLAVRFT